MADFKKGDLEFNLPTSEGTLALAKRFILLIDALTGAPNDQNYFFREETDASNTHKLTSYIPIDSTSAIPSTTSYRFTAIIRLEVFDDVISKYDPNWKTTIETKNYRCILTTNVCYLNDHEWTAFFSLNENDYAVYPNPNNKYVAICERIGPLYEHQISVWFLLYGDGIHFKKTIYSPYKTVMSKDEIINELNKSKYGEWYYSDEERDYESGYTRISYGPLFYYKIGDYHIFSGPITKTSISNSSPSTDISVTYNNKAFIITNARFSSYMRYTDTVTKINSI